MTMHVSSVSTDVGVVGDEWSGRLATRLPNMRDISWDMTLLNKILILLKIQVYWKSKYIADKHGLKEIKN